MTRYFTCERIKATCREAERLGITTHIGRADHHIMRVLLEYWNEGGTIQWIAQTCPELGTIERGVNNAIRGGAKACFVHGGVMDNLLARGQLDEARDAIKMIHDAGMPAGVAGHTPGVFTWAEEHADPDFYMCCYYNPSNRARHAEHRPGEDERFSPRDRDAMTDLIQQLSRPVIHYKIMACGRNDPAEAFAYAARKMRPQDAVCVGIYAEDDPDQLANDVALFEQAVARVSGGG
ncbi:MAG: hypothetical protein JSV65_03370 [Armatimonadota bacterium]|nr:MAG: hypothetical protein JSV65_03370 [Armatimonadota bacterium]